MFCTERARKLQKIALSTSATLAPQSSQKQISEANQTVEPDPELLSRICQNIAQQTQGGQEQDKNFDWLVKVERLEMHNSSACGTSHLCTLI